MRCRPVPLLLTLSLLSSTGVAGAVDPAQAPPLIPADAALALATEISGTGAKRTVQELTLHHRMRGSAGFDAAARAILERARGWETGEARLIDLPADGEIFYGTQRSRPAWNASFAELWELRREDDGWVPARRIASWEQRPVTLAQDSLSGQVTADLVDIGAGTSPEDYAGKEIRGRLVLTSSQPGAAADLAVGRHGAAGIVSYAQNQKSAWWREDETLVRWGHLGTFSTVRTFAFMVSLKQARAWRERLASGETVRLQAEVRAGREPGRYSIPTALIPGGDPGLRDREILFSCHLDHQRPGANDNASGCAAILEAGRALASLVQSGRIPPPRRSLRFVWPPEIEGTIAMLNAQPVLAARTDAVIHMDMVGGDPAVTKAIFHVTRSPRSLPTFVNDVAEALGRFVNEATSAHAGGADHPFALVDPEGGKEALLAEMADFSMGSDHHIWTEGSFRVPAVYLNDWPDRTIHTHADSVGNIDPTKLKRAAFLGAAAGWYLSRLDEAMVPDLWEVVRRHATERRARALERAARAEALKPGSGAVLLRFQSMWEREVLASIGRFAEIPAQVRESAEEFLSRLDGLAGSGDGGGRPEGGTDDADKVYTRRLEPKGPMNGFGYSWLEERIRELGLEKPRLLDYRGLWGSGGEYAYEALNLVDGSRTLRGIHDALTAIYGPLPMELVTGYLETLEKAGVVVGR